VAEMNEKRDDSNRLIDGLICSDRSKGFLSIIRVDLFLSIDDTRYLSILDPSERNHMYLIFSTSYVERPSVWPAQFYYPSVQCTGSSHGGKKQM